MTDYTKTTNFASKDALPSGNANKIVKGTEINTEFDNIATAVTTKANIANPAFTGVVSFPNGSASNPSITNTGDTNAGLFFSAADTLAFSAGGTAQVVFADGVISPVTDSDVDLGTNSLRFKDAYVDSVTVTGNGAITGDLDVDGTIEFDALSGTGSVAITDILDEDDMASNSATALATQQSIKAYVIAQQDTVDSLSEVLALGNTTGDTDISVTDDTKVQFRDSAIYINSSADGQLDIVADTEIQIAATTVDINGAVALNGAVTGATNVTLSGELDAATGDFSGAVDIDGALDVAGTTNLDVVDIDGATQIDATVSVGVDDTGYDVKFFGATSGKSLLWDESADSLIVTGTTTMTGNSTVSGTLGVTGVLTGTSLDISGDIDVDGTTNLDVVDIDGAVDMASTLAVDTRVGIGVAAHASAALNITTTDQHIRFNNGSELGIIDLDSDGELNIWAHGDGETINFKSGSGTGTAVLSVSTTGAVFNETGADADFRVESDGNDHMLFVDGGNNRVGIGAVPLSNGSTFQVTSDITESNNLQLTLRGASDNNKQMIMGFDTTANTAHITTQIAGSAPTPLIFKTGNVVFNETGADADFRVESSGNANMLFVDGGDDRVGIGRVPSISNSKLEVGGADNVSLINVEASGVTGGMGIGASGLQLFHGASSKLAIASDGAATFSAGATFGSHTRVNGDFSVSAASGEDRFAVLPQSAGSGTIVFSGNAALSAYEPLVIDFETLALRTSGTSRLAIAADGSLSTPTAGTSNVRFGVNAGNSIASGGNYNTVVGDEAGTAINTGDNNVAVGYSSGKAMDTGVSNVLVGSSAGTVLTDANYNTAVGAAALASDVEGNYSTAIGYAALNTQNVADGVNTYNTAVGALAGLAVTTGVSNTFVGGLAGDAAQTNSFSTLVGASTDCSDTSSNNCNGFGYAISAVTGYTTIGIGTSDIRAEHGVATWATVSDQRYKKDIVDSTAGLSFINALQPRTFKYKTLGELPDTFRAYEEGSSEVYKSDQTQHGFIAQEVKTAIDAASGVSNGFKMWAERPDGSQEVAEAALIPVLTKAIQELSAQVEALTARIETLEG